MQTVQVQIDPENPDLCISVEAPCAGATIRWLKEELCRQDPTGQAEPSSFRLSAVDHPGVELDDSTAITPSLGALALTSAGTSAGAPGEESRGVELRPVWIESTAEEASCPERGEAGANIAGMWNQGTFSEYTFAVDDPAWRKYLKRSGFCVLRDVLPDIDFREVQEHFWAEIAHVVPGLRRDDPATWDFPGGRDAPNGITRGYGLPQSNFAWAVRSHPRIRRAFELIFGTRDLVVSLDSVKLVGTGVKEPGGLWLHRDQLKDVPYNSVQSIYSFYEVGPENDGTILIPGSHRAAYPWDEWQQARSGAPVPMLRARGRQRNNVRVPEALQRGFMARAIKPRVPGNGLILFNSRTIHASSPDVGSRWIRDQLAAPGPAPPPPRPNRVAVSVAMCPRVRRSRETLIHKMCTVKGQGSSTHWACDELMNGKMWGRYDGLSEGADFQHLPLPDLESHLEWLKLL